MGCKPVLFKPLKLPSGAWQVCWYGCLTEVPQASQTPFITTYLSKVELADGLIPAPLGGKRRAWHYCDKDNRICKCAICLRVTFDAAWGSERRVRYLLDLEGRDGPSQNRILFFWN